MPCDTVAVRSRWDIAILRALKEGQNRPAMLQRHCPQIPRRTLYRRLKHLQQARLIEPTAQPPAPLHGGAVPAALRLTEEGERCLQVVQRLEAAGLSVDQIVQ
ncbi:hypothetical protein HRbin17_00766 [bacterium HR17]|uniref:HTH hxlR-type domain-containing protein n=1 Tax=Candidatus Fervidibacter japonicus TaxID=2035412 RepID=A0A2H5XAS5_9BACT|nr:hypothetical protein HRbin17_00766 [bacterium HR17]